MHRLAAFARDRPLLVLAGAGFAGAWLGGSVLRRAGRLAFIAIASLVVGELWSSESNADVRGLLERIAAGE